MIWVLILVVLASLAVLLWLPLIVRIDTGQHLYELRWKGIGFVAVVPDAEEILMIRFRIFFLEKRCIPCGHEAGRRKRNPYGSPGKNAPVL
jgi:hypothetical protein